MSVSLCLQGYLDTQAVEKTRDRENTRDLKLKKRFPLSIESHHQQNSDIFSECYIFLVIDFVNFEPSEKISNSILEAEMVFERF